MPDRFGKPLVWLAAGAPLAWLVYRTFTGRLGVNPIETLTHFTGLTALTILLFTLSITPLRRLTGWNWLIRYRRLVGLWAFTYVLLHFLVWGLFDHQFSMATIAEDVIERPFIAVGFIAFLILLVLAITSPKAMVRRLGGKRWQQLHRLVYVAAGLGALHYLWGVKAITPRPVVYAVVLGALLSIRLLWRSGPSRRPQGASG